MSETTMTSYITGALQLFMLISLPPLAVAVVIGLLIGILQAATQIQDQTLPQTFKLLAVVGVFAIMTPFIVGPMMTYTIGVFSDFAFLSR